MEKELRRVLPSVFIVDATSLKPLGAGDFYVRCCAARQAKDRNIILELLGPARNEDTATLVCTLASKEDQKTKIRAAVALGSRKLIDVDEASEEKRPRMDNPYGWFIYENSRPEGVIDGLLEIAQQSTKTSLQVAARAELVALLQDALVDPKAAGGFRVDKKTGQPTLNIQRLALASTTRIRDERLVETLIEVLETSHTDDLYVRSEAIQALGRQGDPRAVPAIAEAMEDFRLDAARALSEIGDPGGLAIAVANGVLHEDPEINRIIEEVVDRRSIAILYTEFPEGHDEYDDLKARHDALWQQLRARNDPKIASLLMLHFEECTRTDLSSDILDRFKQRIEKLQA